MLDAMDKLIWTQVEPLSILEWDFDRVLVAHGEIIDSGARDKMHSVFKKYITVAN